VLSQPPPLMASWALYIEEDGRHFASRSPASIIFTVRLLGLYKLICLCELDHFSNNALKYTNTFPFKASTHTDTDGCPDGNLELISTIIPTGCIQTCLCLQDTLSNFTNENLSKKLHMHPSTCSCFSWLLHNNQLGFDRFGLSRNMRCHETANRRDKRS